LEDVEEDIAHLEEILAHILRAASFRRSYLLTKCQNSARSMPLDAK
jgi:CHASE3 domain sensor protein